MRIDRNNNEFLFVLYLYIFAIIKPILALLSPYSTLILLTCVLLVVIKRLMISITISYRNFTIWLLTSVFFVTFLLWGKYIGNYSVVDQYIINFVIYGIIPLFLLTSVKDYSKVLFFVSRLSIVATVIIIADPFIGFILTGGYMEYGFTMLTYSFAGIVLNYYKFEHKWCGLLIIIDLILIAVYGNKGALITALVLLFATIITKERMILKKMILYIMLVLALVFWKQILTWTISIAELFVKDTYSINTFKILLNDSSIITSVRTNIWDDALQVIRAHPFGTGVGFFETYYHGYTHNVELDIAVMFGLAGFFVFVALLIWAIKKLILLKYRNKKIFLLGCLICSMVPLQISLTIWNVLLFWVFWGGILFEQESEYDTSFLKQEN
jgi:membrane protein